MFAFNGSVREEGKGRARTHVYGRIPSMLKGDREVTHLVGGAPMAHPTPLCQLWVSTGLGFDATEDNSFTPV